MNENLEAAVAKLINKSLEGMGQASEFIVSETPDVIQQLMAWYMVKSALVCAIGVILFFLTIHIFKKYSGVGEKCDNEPSKHKWTLTHDDYGDMSPHIIFSAVILLIAIVTCIATINIEWLQIIIAPKVWLIEYAADLVK